MAAHENEIVTVSLHDGTKRNGVVYTIDPEQGWVTVIARDGGGERRLMIVRREWVGFTRRISTDAPPTLDMENEEEKGGSRNRNRNSLSGAELVKELNLRRMEATLDGSSGTIWLLDGTVSIRAPYRADKDVSSTNETIAARVGAILGEISEREG